MPQQFYYPYTTTGTTTNTVYPQNWPNTITTGTQVIWNNWNQTTTNQYLTNTYSNQVWIEWNQTPITYTPEQLRDWQETQERQRVAHEERHRVQMEARSAARAKARLLLGEFLDDQQKAELERHGRFHVTGSRGRRYCIRAEGQSGNVDLLKPDGSLQARLCCHPRQVPGSNYELLPEGDAWLMQMIEIRHDEDHFLRTANIHRGRLPADYAHA